MPLSTLDQAPAAAKKLGNWKMDTFWTGGLILGTAVAVACGYADYAGAVGGYAAYLGAAALAGAGSIAFSGYKLGRSYWDRSNLAEELEVITNKEIAYRRAAEAALDHVAVDMSALAPAIQNDAAFAGTPGTAVVTVIGARAAQLAATNATLRAQRV